MPVTGTIQQATRDQYFFTDSLTGDVHLRSLSNISWLFGWGSNTTSTMKVNPSTVNINSSNVVMTGNVGVGTYFPSYKLDVGGSINMSGTLYQNGVAFNPSPWLSNSSNAYLLGGNVGIGKSNPTRSLEVVGTAYADVVATSSLTSQTGALNIGTDAGTSTINIGGATSTVSISGTLAYVNAADLTISDRKITFNKGGLSNSAGDTGFEIEENGSITGYIKTSSDRNSFLFKTPNGSSNAVMNLSGNAMNFNNNSLVVASNNYVGISKSNPQYPLDVIGSAAFSGAIITTSSNATIATAATPYHQLTDTNAANSNTVILQNSAGSLVVKAGQSSNLAGGSTPLTVGPSGVQTSVPLTVQSSNAAVITVTSQSSNSTAGLTLTTGAGSFSVAAEYGNKRLNVTDGVNNLMSFNNSNVGINNTSPAYKLDVNGTANVSDKLYVTNDILIGTTNVSEKLSISAGNAALVHGGTYGGATSTDKWQSMGDKSLAAAPHYQMSNYGISAAWSNDGCFFGLRDYNGQKDTVVSSTKNVRFQAASNNDLMILTSAGRLGIGTTSPSYNLDVVGTVNASQLLINGSALSSSTGGGFSAVASSITYTSCNVGVGKSNPSCALDVNGSIQASGVFTTGLTVRKSTGTIANVTNTITSIPGYTFNTNTSNVGINNTSPLYGLDVAGTGRFSTSTASTDITIQNASAASGHYFKMGHDSGDLFHVYSQSNVGVYMTNGATTWTANSDERIKKDVTTIANCLDKVIQIRPVKYHYIDDAETAGMRVGVLAQDVQRVLPEAVVESISLAYGYTDLKGVNYTELIPILIGSITELKQEIDEKDRLITDIMSRLEKAGL